MGFIALFHSQETRFPAEVLNLQKSLHINDKTQAESRMTSDFQGKKTRSTGWSFWNPGGSLLHLGSSGRADQVWLGWSL